MGYNHFDEKEQLYCSQQFITEDEANKLLDHLRFLNFNLAAVRSSALVYLDNVEFGQLEAALNTRFPEFRSADGKTYHYYYQWNDDELVDIITNIAISLSYKAPDIAETNKDHSDKTTNFQQNKTNSGKINRGAEASDDGNLVISNLSERNKFEKALYSFEKNVENLSSYFKKHRITRFTFERKFSLTWTP